MPVLAAASLVAQACEIPNIIDVSKAERFGEPVVSVRIPTSAEHDAVQAALRGITSDVQLHISPIFGLGSFTGDTKETQRILDLAYQHPYNVYGTSEYSQMQEWLADVEARELDVWSSMTVEQRNKAIEAEIRKQHDSGNREFGNCWHDPDRDSSD